MRFSPFGIIWGAIWGVNEKRPGRLRAGAPDGGLSPRTVIPACAGIQRTNSLGIPLIRSLFGQWTPAFARVTDVEFQVRKSYVIATPHLMRGRQSRQVKERRQGNGIAASLRYSR